MQDQIHTGFNSLWFEKPPNAFLENVTLAIIQNVHNWRSFLEEQYQLFKYWNDTVEKFKDEFCGNSPFSAKHHVYSLLIDTLLYFPTAQEFY